MIYKAVLNIASDWKARDICWAAIPETESSARILYIKSSTLRAKIAKPYRSPQIIDYRNTGTIESSGVFFPASVPESYDLVLWDSHIGIIVDPNEGKFIGVQTSTGLAKASYTSGYWAEKSGKPFIRFVHFF